MGRFEWRSVATRETRSAPSRWRDPDFITPVMFFAAFIGVVMLIAGGNALYQFLVPDKDPVNRFGSCSGVASADCVTEEPVAMVDATNPDHIVVRSVDGSEDHVIKRSGGSRPSDLGGSDRIDLESWHGGQYISLVDEDNGAVMQLPGYPPPNPIYWEWQVGVGVLFSAAALFLFLRRRTLRQEIEAET